MRQIGTLPSEGEARTFEAYLLARGVKANVEQSDGAWAVWVVEEDDVAPARQEFQEFAEHPDDPRFVEGAKAAAELRRQKQKKLSPRPKIVNMRDLWRRPLSSRAPVTTALIAISLFVAAFGTDWSRALDDGPLNLNLCTDPDSFVSYLFIAPVELQGGGRGWWQPALGLSAIWHGQVWRLVTPIFLHFGPLHILFNMLWLRDLGGVIETRRGSLRMLGLVLVIAVLSNLAQFYWPVPLFGVSGKPSPMFGGMSGVVFGLFGYIWMKSRYEPESGFAMPSNLVFLMIVWFLVCFTGMVGPIANTAHSVGLMTGMVIGYLPAYLRRRLA